MNELEQQLELLREALEFPPAPDLTSSMLARLPARRWTQRIRRTALIAWAAVLIVVGVAAAVPGSRHAVLRVLGLRGATIERVPRLPSVPLAPLGTRLGLGTPIPFARARHAASFRALLPRAPAPAYLGHDVPGGRISLFVGHLLVTEFRGTSTPFVFKLIGPGTRIKNVRVSGGPGVYLSGAPHVVLFQAINGSVQTDRVRLAGNVLLWQHGRLTLRIEGSKTLQQALALARSLR